MIGDEVLHKGSSCKQQVSVGLQLSGCYLIFNQLSGSLPDTWSSLARVSTSGIFVKMPLQQSHCLTTNLNQAILLAPSLGLSPSMHFVDVNNVVSHAACPHPTHGLTCVDHDVQSAVLGAGAKKDFAI